MLFGFIINHCPSISFFLSQLMLNVTIVYNFYLLKLESCQNYSSTGTVGVAVSKWISVQNLDFKHILKKKNWKRKCENNLFSRPRLARQ